MNVAPYRFAELDRGDNFTAMGEEETERGQLLRLEVNHILAAQKRPIRFQAETSKSDFRLTIPGIGSDDRGPEVSGGRRLRRGRLYPIQYRSLRLLVNQIAGFCPAFKRLAITDGDRAGVSALDNPGDGMYSSPDEFPL
jgi:hypothetical protein